MRIRENHPFPRKPVHARRRDFSVPIEGAHITDAEVIGENENDVRLFRRDSSGENGEQGEDGAQDGKHVEGVNGLWDGGWIHPD